MARSAHGFCPQMDKGNFRDQNLVFERQQKPDYSRQRGKWAVLLSALLGQEEGTGKTRTAVHAGPAWNPSLGRQGQKSSKPSSATTVSSITA